MNWHKLDELYDLSAGREASIGLRDFCNQIVHSFVFVLSIAASGGLQGFFVASDREKSQGLLYFDIDSVSDALLRVSRCDIVVLEISRAAVRGPLRISKRPNRQDPGRSSCA